MKIVNPMFDLDYKGSQGCELDQTPCELYDDMPYIPLKERVARAVASGQLLDDYRYMQVHSDFTDRIEDIDTMSTALDSAEYACDLIQSYKDIRDKRVARQRAYYASQSKAQNNVEKSENPAPPKKEVVTDG